MAAPVRIGDRIAGKYVVEAVIGEGGMGVVVAARHEELEQSVAIKVLLPEIALEGTAAERFRREARSAARIRSEHVCRVLDVGTLDSGVPYLVMEHLEGGDLAVELEKRGRLPLTEAVEYMLQACEGVAEAHAAGVVHRDIKPGNLYLARRADGSRRVKVLDFGVSKALDDTSSGRHKLTQTSAFVGSPLYMSPEQLGSSHDVDERADIWALGVVFFELLHGKPPFSGDSIPQLVSRVMYDAQPSLEVLEPDLPKGIDAILARALAKDRDVRYPSIAALATDLLPFAPRHARESVSRISPLMSPEARKPAVAADAAPLSDTGTTPDEALSASKRQSTPLSWSNRDAQPRTGSRAWRGALLLLLLLAAGGAALLYWLPLGPSGREPGPPIAAPAKVVEPAANAATRPEAAASDPLPPAAPSPPPVAAPEAANPAADQAADHAPGPAPEPASAAAEHAQPHTRSRPQSSSAPEPAKPAAPAAPAPPEAAPPGAAKTGISDFGGRR